MPIPITTVSFLMSSSKGQLMERYDVACKSQRMGVKFEQFSDATNKLISES